MDGASAVSPGMGDTDTHGRNDAFRTPQDKAFLTPKPILL